jgi:hypothetical protein
VHLTKYIANNSDTYLNVSVVLFSSPRVDLCLRKMHKETGIIRLQRMDSVNACCPYVSTGFHPQCRLFCHAYVCKDANVLDISRWCVQ